MLPLRAGPRRQVSGSPRDFYRAGIEEWWLDLEGRAWLRGSGIRSGWGNGQGGARRREQGQCPPEILSPRSLGLLAHYRPILLSGPSPFQTLPSCPLPP